MAFTTKRDVERGIQIFPHKGAVPYCYAGWPKGDTRPNCMKQREPLSWDITQEELKTLFSHIVFNRKRPAEENPEVIAKRQRQEEAEALYLEGVQIFKNAVNRCSRSLMEQALSLMIKTPKLQQRNS
jgi:hypothetical protein